MTENYYILFQNPLTLSLWKLLGFALYRNGAAELMTFDRSRPMVVHVIPRRGDVEAGRRSFPIGPAHFSFHHANAYETADGRIIADRRVLMTASVCLRVSCAGACLSAVADAHAAGYFIRAAWRGEPSRSSSTRTNKHLTFITGRARTCASV